MKIKYLLDCYLANFTAVMHVAHSKKIQAVILPKPVDTANTIKLDYGKIKSFQKHDAAKTDAFLEDILKQYPQYFDSILKNRKDGMYK